MDHAAFQELTAGRALGDLAPGERAAAEAHLAFCRACVRLSHDLARVIDDLSLAPVQRTPPAWLEARILASLPGAEPGAQPRRPVALPPALPLVRQARPPSRQDRVARALGSSRFPGFALATAAVVVIVALGAHALDLRRQLADERQLAAAATADLDSREAAMAVVANHAHSTAWLQPSAETADARTAPALMVYLPGSTQAFLMAEDLPPSPAGMVYQFWYADAAGVHPGRTFHHDGSGVLLVPVSVDLGGAQAAMLTLEPEGTADDAPGRDVVFGELPRS